MSNQYTDIQIIECNRLSSEEAKGGNSENYALWTNNLTDIVHINPGDQVSLYQSFISEVGAGQGTTVEIKGVELGPKVTLKFITLEPYLSPADSLDRFLPSQASRINAVENSSTFSIRDDTLKFTISYYLVANALNSLKLPRRYMFIDPLPRVNFTTIDSVVNGFGWAQPQIANSTVFGNGNFYFEEDFYSNIEDVQGDYIYKNKNDNTRYTLMIRSVSYYTQEIIDDTGSLGNLVDLRDPENAIYYPYKELKEFTLPAGYNSPEFIAEEISRQFQGIVKDTQYFQRDEDTDGQFPISVSKILESETYKAFNTGNIYDNSKDNFLHYFNLKGSTNSSTDRDYRAGWTNISGWEWLRQYQIVATKYPELYETGRLINMNGSSQYTGVLGSQVELTWGAADGQANRGIILDIPYNKENCDLFKAFFDAQKIYPEIIDKINRSSGYRPGCTLNNTRWLHMNRFETAKQSLANPPTLETTQLGWGGYQLPRSYQLSRATTQLMSLLLPLFFDSTQENIFYELPDDNLKQYTYGCLGRSNRFGKVGYIEIFPNRHPTNGFFTNTNLWNRELMTSSVGGLSFIEGNRKVGFDMHFNAPGMHWMMPLSGWTNTPDNQSSTANAGGSFEVPNSENDNKASGSLTDLTPWKKLLYIGADQPSLKWDGTFFSWSGFHTGINRGNDWQNGNPAFPTEKVNDNAADTVYFINPPNYAADYTPDRTPYVFDPYNLSQKITQPSTKITVERLNSNFTPWQIYDMLCGIYVEDYGVTEEVWEDSLWGILGFTYKQLNGTNNRQVRIQKSNANNLSKLTTNCEILEGDTKILSTNWASTPMYNQAISTPTNIFGYNAAGSAIIHNTRIYPRIAHATQSISIVADRLPTRMRRGYYSIRSNILEGTPFIGGLRNNTTLPIIGIVNKTNLYGDYITGEGSEISFTITKPIKLASISVSIHDPDGTFARVDRQSSILFKITRQVANTFNVAQEIIESMGPKKGQRYLENVGAL